jgi:RNA polymerase sigma factor (TIGR02999 family)
VAEPSPGEITQLLIALGRGDRDAEARLIPLVYDELRRLANRFMQGERPNHTLQPTALVHEAYLRLIEQERVEWRNRAHFFGVAAKLMRRILVDHARARLTAKRGAAEPAVHLKEGFVFAEERCGEFVALDEALQRLAQFDPRADHVVELRFFGGLSEEDTAQMLGISTRTVKRDWNAAKAWLRGEMTQTEVESRELKVESKKTGANLKEKPQSRGRESRVESRK